MFKVGMKVRLIAGKANYVDNIIGRHGKAYAYIIEGIINNGEFYRLRIPGGKYYYSVYEDEVIPALDDMKCYKILEDLLGVNDG